MPNNSSFAIHNLIHPPEPKTPPPLPPYPYPKFYIPDLCSIQILEPKTDTDSNGDNDSDSNIPKTIAKEVIEPNYYHYLHFI